MHQQCTCTALRVIATLDCKQITDKVDFQQTRLPSLLAFELPIATAQTAIILHRGLQIEHLSAFSWQARRSQQTPSRPCCHRRSLLYA
jgi:hypothetical protein